MNRPTQPTRPYRVGTALTQQEKDLMTKAMLQTKMNEPMLVLTALNNLFYTLERAVEGYGEVSFVNKQGEVYTAPIIQTPR